MKKDVKKLTIKELIKDISHMEVIGDECVLISSLAFDSRKVLPGSLFIAISGLKEDGIHYIDEAIDHGAVAVMVENSYEIARNVTIIKVMNIRIAMAQMAKRFYNGPDEALHLIGVTGTNGKTTVTALSQYLLQEENYRVGLIGTIHHDLGTKTLPATKTTPEALEIQSMLSQMLNMGCKSAIMEVSSHGIVLKRVQSMHFDIGVFLNLTQDHLDFHGDMETYFQAKREFFNGTTANIPKIVIINIDDAYGMRLYREIGDCCRVITLGESSEAQICAKDIELTDKGLSFNLIYEGESILVNSHLLGAYNVSNILAALAIGLGSGRDIQALVRRLADFQGVRGRMEKVDLGQDFSVLVDYAHTGDALNNVLKILKAITRGRLLLVFGCGGDRDRGKRAAMVLAAQQWADFAWATADNPRNEPLEQIFNDMRQAVITSEKILFVPDRRRAIDRAIDAAQSGDCILIAGKGHETYQVLGDRVIPFDDCQVARELLRYKNKVNVSI